MAVPLEELKRLQEVRATLEQQIKDHADTLDACPDDEAKGEWQSKWDALNTDYDANKADLDKANAENKQQADIQARLDQINAENRDRPRFGRDGAELRDENPNGQPTDEDRGLALQGWFRAAHPGRFQLSDEHHAAAKRCGIALNDNELILNLPTDFNAVRSTLNSGRRAFSNALSGLDGTAGGYTFSETFVANLEMAMLAFGGMFQIAEVIRTSTGEPMRWPTADDTGNTGVQIGESAAVASDTDPTFGQVIWNAYKFSSKEIKVPFELLRDSAVNLAQVLSSMLGERLGRIQNTKYTTGTGANTAKGITVAAAAGVTTASSTAIAFDEVIDLEHSLDPSRRNMGGVGYMFHDNILKALRKLKDGEGRYLWQAGANTGAPDMLNQFPYQVNQDMSSTITSGDITMLFGQFSQYKIRQVNAVRLYRLTERHRENDQDAFLAFVEGDGNLLDAGDNPVKKMTQV